MSNDFFTFSQSFVNEYESLFKGKWLPIFWPPYTGAEEKLMFAVAMMLNNQFVVKKILDDDLLKTIYQQRKKNANNIFSFVIESLNHELTSSKSLESLSPLFENISFGEIRPVAASNFSEAIAQVVDLNSSLTNRERYLRMERAENRKEVWASTIEHVFNALFKRPSFGNFGKKITLRDNRNVTIGYATRNNKFAAQFATLSDISQFKLIHSKVLDLQLLKKSGMFARTELIVHEEEQTKELFKQFQDERTDLQMPKVEEVSFFRQTEVASLYLYNQAMAYS